MTISTSTRAMLATAALALLAGCAGGSQVAPSTVGQQSAHKAISKTLPQIAPGRYATPNGAHMNLGGKKTISFVLPDKVKKCKKDCWNLVVASDNIYGNLDVYTGAGSSGPSYIGTAAGIAGWGVASYSNDEVAWGSSSYGILVGNFSATSSTLDLNETAQLIPSELGSGYNAYGLAFDSKGNIYGGDWPGPCIDEWNASTVAGYSGSPLAPDATWCSSDIVELYQFGIKGKTIYADGYDANFNVALDTINFGAGKEKITEDPITNSLGGFPGGVASTTKGEVYVNDQYGTIYGYKGGKGAANQSVNWGFDPNDYTAINLDYSQANLWAADINFGGSYLYSYIEDNSAPLGSAETSGATSGAPNNEYLGVAAVSAQK